VVSPGNIFVVLGHQADRVRAAIASSGIQFVDQFEPYSAGMALRCAQSVIEAYDHVLVLPGDVPLIRPETLQELWSFHMAEQAAMTTLTALPEVDSGIYAFRTSTLFAHLDHLTAAKDVRLAGMAAILTEFGESVAVIQAHEDSEVLGAASIVHLSQLDAQLRAAAAARLMVQGVTIFRPETCVIDAAVEVGPDTVIEPFVQLLGSTRIGSDCLIRSYSVIENCTLGDNVLLRQSCILTDSMVADGAKIGPFAHLRPGSDIGPDAHVGNFVETKKAKLGKGAKANHLTYIGDAEVGEGTNIGAGVITCNYDGVHKHTTRIGKGVFVGSDSTLVAPISIHDGAYIGAGSCITKDVPADSLAVGRSHQVTKEGWAAARRALLKAKEDRPNDPK
jgi:bifunctional UDP-N-acetylglucosamine pyrophosphorylase/glucosamine-1-phosphate N-acetyltransferase